MIVSAWRHWKRSRIRASMDRNPLPWLLFPVAALVLPLVLDVVEWLS